jgi:GT2 family glycosyltransferase
MDQSSVTVVIASHNTRELLINAIASVFRYAGESVETVVVDNASEDGSCDAVRKRFPVVRLIENRTNLGFAAACNQAIGDTGSEFVLLLNSDAELMPNTLVGLLECMQALPRCAAAGCLTRDGSGAAVTTTRNFLTPFNQPLEMLFRIGWPRWRSLSRTYRPRLDGFGRDSEVDWIEASCLLIRRTAFQEEGGFDERFFMYSEDEDFCLRLKRAGWTVCYTSSAEARHIGGASSTAYGIEMLRHFYRSQLLFLLKHRGMLSVTLYAIAMRAVLMIKSRLARGPSGVAGERQAKAADRLLALRQAYSDLHRGE